MILRTLVFFSFFTLMMFLLAHIFSTFMFIYAYQIQDIYMNGWLFYLKLSARHPECKRLGNRSFSVTCGDYPDFPRLHMFDSNYANAQP